MRTSPFHVDLTDEGTGVCEQDKHMLDSVSFRAVLRAGTGVHHTSCTCSKTIPYL